MSATLKCPKCSCHIKEEGDTSKSNEKEYRVYSSHANPKHKQDSFRAILCLVCNSFSDINEFYGD